MLLIVYGERKLFHLGDEDSQSFDDVIQLLALILPPNLETLFFAGLHRANLTEIRGEECCNWVLSLANFGRGVLVTHLR